MKIILHSIIALLLLSCKSENINDRSPALIQVTISEASFESVETLGNRAATPAENTIQRNTIELNKDFLMVAELRPEEPAYAPLKKDQRAALETTPLAPNVRYRVLVYNQAGGFVTERNYIRGQEANTEALELDGGSTYTFVVLSINSTNDLPPTTPAVGIRNLANSQVNTTGSSPTALMYYRHTMTVSANSINRLDIVLKHRKPLINVTVNSAQTGYNITAAVGRFDPHNNSTVVNLSDGSHIQNGTNVGMQVNFNGVGSQNIVNTSTSYINAPGNNITTFTLLSITIGSITATNLVPFTNLTVTPGVRYNLILNIVPNDQYITHGGRPAARINGRIWALHNVGVATTVNHDPATITSAQHGNYYQFGKSASVAGPTATSPNNNWTSNSPGSGAWNSGTEANPIKTQTDPCPASYRIPTQTEFQQLINATVDTERGPFTNGSTFYNSGKVLTSRRNASVRLVLPAQGFINVTQGNPVTPGALSSRGASGNYSTSSASGVNTWRLAFSLTDISVGLYTADANSFYYGRPLRCVGI